MNDPLYLKTTVGTCICEYLSLKSNLRVTSTIQCLQSQKSVSEIYVFFTVIYINATHLDCKVSLIQNIREFGAKNFRDSAPVLKICGCY